MDAMQGEEEALMGRSRAEIDTRSPFASVKQAVSLFGERVLAGEIYATKLQEISEMRGEWSGRGSIGALRAELEETKQRLEKAREEANFMARCIQSLKQEMEQTKRELREAKARELMLLQDRVVDETETEELKFVESANKVDHEAIKTQVRTDQEAQGKDVEFEKRRYVKFASPHALAHVIKGTKDEMTERDASVKKKAKRKPLMPIIGWLFARKKAENDSRGA